jgi:hypothetical protein
MTKSRSTIHCALTAAVARRSGGDRCLPTGLASWFGIET